MQLLFWERKNFFPDGASRKAKRLRPLDLWQTYEKILFGRLRPQDLQSPDTNAFFIGSGCLRGLRMGKPGNYRFSCPNR
jgi:hypothetical protein